MKKLFLKTILISTLLSSFGAISAEHQIKMLNIGKEGTMVFEPSIIKAQKGDTITFLPEQAGHYVESKAIPEGAQHFKSEMDEKYSITLDKEGVYIYVCPPHMMMGMWGVIQVGEAINMDKIKEIAPKLDRRSMQNKGRLLNYIDQIK